ncbi:hypothetical protein PFNF135_03789 [Plasmodium falciparum NF135/5.C10]|uniref:Uncharacterized protein n=1 Tax=Plasmodium falciparum NF135/5.C10 TaxID=1036726 RepID=W4IDV5_PLAFA|nr:hypothetical protein PFNF135_03789 [Plasmodium falciparum NF135/5.C10]
MSCVKKKSVMLIIFYLILFLIFFPVNKTKYVSSYYRAHIKKINKKKCFEHDISIYQHIIT